MLPFHPCCWKFIAWIVALTCVSDSLGYRRLPAIRIPSGSSKPEASSYQEADQFLTIAPYFADPSRYSVYTENSKGNSFSLSQDSYDNTYIQPPLQEMPVADSLYGNQDAEYPQSDLKPMDDSAKNSTAADASKKVKLKIQLMLGHHPIPAFEYEIPRWWFRRQPPKHVTVAPRKLPMKPAHKPTQAAQRRGAVYSNTPLKNPSVPGRVTKDCPRGDLYFTHVLPPTAYASPLVRPPVAFSARWSSSEPFVFQNKRKSTDPGPNYFLQISFGSIRTVTGWKVTGKGQKEDSGAVAAYTVKLYQPETKRWMTVMGPEKQPRVFSAAPYGSSTRAAEVYPVHISAINADAIRFYPIQWSGKPYFKVDVRGCSVTHGAVPTPSGKTTSNSKAVKRLQPSRAHKPRTSTVRTRAARVSYPAHRELEFVRESTTTPASTPSQLTSSVTTTPGKQPTKKIPARTKKLSTLTSPNPSTQRITALSKAPAGSKRPLSVTRAPTSKRTKMSPVLVTSPRVLNAGDEDVLRREKEFRRIRNGTKFSKSLKTPTVKKASTVSVPIPTVCQRIPLWELKFFEIDYGKRIQDLGVEPDLGSAGYVNLRLLSPAKSQQNKNNHISLEVDFAKPRPIQQLLFKGAVREGLPAIMQAFYLQYFSSTVNRWEWVSHLGQPKPFILSTKHHLNSKDVQTIFPISLGDGITTSKLRIFPELWQKLPVVRLAVIACG